MAARRLAARTAREQTGSPALERIQATSRDAISDVTRCPFLFGRLISVKLSGGVDKVIRHGLGVPARAMLVSFDYSGNTGSPALNESSAAVQQPLDQRQDLAILANADCTVDVWFYPRASKTIDPRTGIGT